MKSPYKDPVEIFERWLEKAKRQETGDPTVMTLATATKSGVPSLRVVLLKEFDQKGFVFYTNLHSRKAKDLLKNPKAALCFYWPAMDRQVRIEGKVTLVSNEEADAYFASRPRGSQLGAWVSWQSRPMKSPEELWGRVEQYKKKFRYSDIPRPQFWSGFRLVPSRIEFWRRGAHRLHERICYSRKRGRWDIFYLYP